MLPTDRRVKAVSLTPKGELARDELLRLFYETPPEILALDRATLSALQRGLAKLPRPTRGVSHGPTDR